MQYNILGMISFKAGLFQTFLIGFMYLTYCISLLFYYCYEFPASLTFGYLDLSIFPDIF